MVTLKNVDRNYYILFILMVLEWLSDFYFPSIHFNDCFHQSSFIIDGATNNDQHLLSTLTHYI